MFQSSPAPKGGRYVPGAGGGFKRIVVSILARPEGRALPGLIGGTLKGLAVSILARPEGRALLQGKRQRHRVCTRFNPRPPRRAGATGQAVVKAAEPIRVSILARPEGRALQDADFEADETLEVSILARPEGRALRGNHW